MKSNNDERKLNEEQQRISQAIIDKLAQFDVQLKLEDIIVGATVTRYVFSVLSSKTRMDTLRKLADEIWTATQSSYPIMLHAPLSGTSNIAVDVANTERRRVELSDLLDSPEFKNAKGELVFPVGEDVSGKVVVADLAKLPHLLVAGTTGSGKSIFLSSLIVSMIYKYSPEHVRLVIADSKGFDLAHYRGLPHMLVPDLITEIPDILLSLDYLIAEMEARYQLFRSCNVANIRDYNNQINPKLTQKLPYLVFILDEFGDVMYSDKRAFEVKVLRLAQKSRAAGIHIVLSTQRTGVENLTGTIKANMPARVALKVCSVYDSMTILNGGGAEKLVGMGDMLFMDPCRVELTRLQSAYVSREDTRMFVDRSIIVDKTHYDQSVINQIFVSRLPAQEQKTDEEKSTVDELYPYYKKALRFWLERNNGKASIASIQRGLNVGFNRAGRIFENLQRMGYVEKFSNEGYEFGNRAINVLVTLDELDDLFPDTDDAN